MSKKSEVKEKVEKEISKCLEDGLDEQEAIVHIRRNLSCSYSVTVKKVYTDSEGHHAKNTAFYKLMKKARIEGTPRMNGELMK